MPNKTAKEAVMEIGKALREEIEIAKKSQRTYTPEEAVAKVGEAVKEQIALYKESLKKMQSKESGEELRKDLLPDVKPLAPQKQMSTPKPAAPLSIPQMAHQELGTPKGVLGRAGDKVKNFFSGPQAKQQSYNNKFNTEVQSQVNPQAPAHFESKLNSILDGPAATTGAPKPQSVGQHVAGLAGQLKDHIAAGKVAQAAPTQEVAGLNADKMSALQNIGKPQTQAPAHATVSTPAPKTEYAKPDVAPKDLLSAAKTQDKNAIREKLKSNGLLNSKPKVDLSKSPILKPKIDSSESPILSAKKGSNPKVKQGMADFNSNSVKGSNPRVKQAMADFKNKDNELAQKKSKLSELMKPIKKDIIKQKLTEKPATPAQTKAPTEAAAPAKTEAPKEQPQAAAKPEAKSPVKSKGKKTAEKAAPKAEEKKPEPKAEEKKAAPAEKDNFVRAKYEPEHKDAPHKQIELEEKKKPGIVTDTPENHKKGDEQAKDIRDARVAREAKEKKEKKSGRRGSKLKLKDWGKDLVNKSEEFSKALDGLGANPDSNAELDAKTEPKKKHKNVFKLIKGWNPAAGQTQPGTAVGVGDMGGGAPDMGGGAPDMAKKAESMEGDHYNYYLVHKGTGKIHGGYEYKEDAHEAAKDHPEAGQIKVSHRTKVSPEAKSAYHSDNKIDSKLHKEAESMEDKNAPKAKPGAVLPNDKKEVVAGNPEASGDLKLKKEAEAMEKKSPTLGAKDTTSRMMTTHAMADAAKQAKNSKMPTRQQSTKMPSPSDHMNRANDLMHWMNPANHFQKMDELWEGYSKKDKK